MSNQLTTHLNVSATSINSGGKSPPTIGDNPGSNHFGILVTIMAVINTTSDCFTTPIVKVHFLFRIYGYKIRWITRVVFVAIIGHTPSFIARDLIIDLTLHKPPYSVYARNEGAGSPEPSLLVCECDK